MPVGAGSLILAAIVVLAGASAAQAQLRLDRLDHTELEALPPSARVAGPPGGMHITRSACGTVPAADLRRRIVDIAVQEWGFFGFTVVDQTDEDETEDRQDRTVRGDREDRQRRRSRRRPSWLNPEESVRVADTIAGYWAITADGGWILSRQNAVWKGYEGVAARWRDPWSAAFVSWVMCESGLGDPDRFRRAIAHHAYIDQAIEARYADASPAAFTAYDVGEVPIEPGDLLCSARRSAYRSIADRRRELGIGIRSHCDIVVKVDAANDRILGIGGNVRGAVSLKLLPAAFALSGDGELAVESVGRGRRNIFAHLKLRAAPVDADAFETSPTMQALAERIGAAAAPAIQAPILRPVLR